VDEGRPSEPHISGAPAFDVGADNLKIVPHPLFKPYLALVVVCFSGNHLPGNPHGAGIVSTLLRALPDFRTIMRRFRVRGKLSAERRELAWHASAGC
jgi:hypothetical protein